MFHIAKLAQETTVTVRYPLITTEAGNIRMTDEKEKEGVFVIAVVSSVTKKCLSIYSLTVGAGTSEPM